MLKVQWQRGGLYGFAALLFLFLTLGGGGGEAPLLAAVLEALALVALGVLIVAALRDPAPPRPPLAPTLLLVAALLLVILQLIPLPFSAWTRLPGRELAAEATRLAGLGAAPLPLSLNAEATRTSALALLPPIAIFFATLFRTPRERLIGLWVVVAAATLSAFAGALQAVRPGAPSLYLFDVPGFNMPRGLFANQNHQALFLLLGILALSGLIRLGKGQIALTRDRAIHMGWPLGALLAVMVLATGSRFGALALFPTVLIATALAIKARRLSRGLAIGASVALASVAAVMLFAPGLVSTVGARFGGAGNDLRSRALPDLFYAIDVYKPFGSGLGTFDPVFRGVESLDIVDTAYLNAAHNDYIQLAIETGFAGIALIAVFLLLWAWKLWQAIRDRSGSAEVVQQRVAAAMIGLTLVHSALDYPLRMIAHLSLFAFACALLFSRGPRDVVQRRGRRSRR